MKDYIKQLIAAKSGNLLKTLAIREYLQARLLQTCQECGVFLNWAFHGGTSLRFLFSIPRFSEDLDFSLIDPNKRILFRKVLNKINNVFEAENYSLRMKVSDEKTVFSAFIQFEGLLFEMGLSPQPSQVFSIKIELDTKPPVGANYATTIVRKYVTLNILHHDKASLLAGKLHAILSRSYVKGRDLYDLVWYLADKSWPPPNIKFLNSALEQIGWSGTVLTTQNWRDILIDRLSSINWLEAQNDVRPFLERESEIDLVSEETCLRLLKGD